jgi:3-phenylpropionate/trans-cinnamate dioxygenase ferredoxin reductase component
VGKNIIYDTIPWFWSDQYDIKLQIVGLSTGYNEVVVRKEESETTKFSVWYFKDNELLAVDAINNAKAYVYGTKFIKERKLVDKVKLADNTVEFKIENLLIT